MVEQGPFRQRRQRVIDDIVICLLGQDIEAVAAAGQADIHLAGRVRRIKLQAGGAHTTMLHDVPDAMSERVIADTRNEQR